MDSVHHPEVRSWISPKVKLKTYFDDFKLAIESNGRGELPAKKMIEDKRKFTQYHLRLLMQTPPPPLELAGKAVPGVVGGRGCQITEEMIKNIAQQCDIDSLKMAGEVPTCQQFAEPELQSSSDPVATTFSDTLPRFAFHPIPKEGSQSLKCLELQQAFLDNATGYDKEKRKKMSRYPGIHWFEAAPPKPHKGRLGMMEEQMIVTVRIYRPFKKDLQQPNLTLNSTKYVQEFHLLGTNYLSQLRDLIKCPTDLMTGGDMSENPPWVKKVEPLVPDKKEYPLKVIQMKKSEETSYFKKAYKSGFFYIEGCFYNDMRWPSECRDYSEVIREWAEDPKRKIGPFATAKMEETKIEELEIRFGYPYVYVHQGQHEHLLSFTEARLVSADDPQYAATYPFERSSGIHHSRFCMICSVNVAKWVTTDNERVPEDPFFFCDGCFRDFNYDQEDKKNWAFPSLQLCRYQCPVKDKMISSINM